MDSVYLAYLCCHRPVCSNFHTKTILLNAGYAKDIRRAIRKKLRCGESFASFRTDETKAVEKMLFDAEYYQKQYETQT